LLKFPNAKLPSRDSRLFKAVRKTSLPEQQHKAQVPLPGSESTNRCDFFNTKL